MAARRRTARIVIVAALLGLASALCRLQFAPELRVRTRDAANPSAVELAAAIGWPSAPKFYTPMTGDNGSAINTHPGMAPALRDALGERTFPVDQLAMSSPRVFAAAAHYDDKSPVAAKMGHNHASGSRALSSSHLRKEQTHGSLRRRNYAPRAADERPLRVPLRVPLARGPAPPDEANDGDDGEAVAAGLFLNELHPNMGVWTRRRVRAFPLFRPPLRRAIAAKKAPRPRRVRPLLLSKLLGRDALRPPPSSIVPPDLSALQGRKPKLLPDGSPVPTLPYELERLESLDPRRAEAICRRRAPHWDDGLLWHDGSARGVIENSRWQWLWKEKTRWWAVSQPDSVLLLHHKRLWWGKQRGVWFALHDGELWSWRRFADWDAEGLLRLGDGVELVYSSDFTKVAVITPGAGAVLYDAATGAELGEWLESELPRRRPLAPTALSLPRGI